MVAHRRALAPGTSLHTQIVLDRWSVFGAKIHRVSATRIQLSSHGGARIQVEGRGFGRLRVGGQRRWVWGSFDESFAIRASQKTLEIVLRTLLSRDKRELTSHGHLDVAPPRINQSFVVSNAVPRAELASIPKSPSLCIGTIGGARINLARLRQHTMAHEQLAREQLGRDGKGDSK